MSFPPLNQDIYWSRILAHSAHKRAVMKVRLTVRDLIRRRRLGWRT